MRLLIASLIFAVSFLVDLDLMGDVCTAIYAIEAILKILFYGKVYFTEGWNLYDFICLCGIIFFRILFAIITIEHNPVVIFLTLFRVAKLMTLFRVLKLLRRMFQTMVLALPAMSNLAILVLLINYIFAVVGVILFSGTKMQAELNGNANFKDLITAFLTVFRMASGDSWGAVAHDLTRTKTQYFYCIDSATYEDIQLNNGETIGCGSAMGAIYACLMQIVMGFIFLNLFMAIVVSSTLETSDLSESVLNDEILDKYQNTWAEFDPSGSGLLEYSKLWSFLCRLNKPLGVCEEEMTDSYNSAITLWMLDLKIYYYKNDAKHYVNFYDVLEALVKKSIYRPQTLNMIFNHQSKDELIEGLQKLWAEKSSLLVEDQEELGKVEALNYYYQTKAASIKKGVYQLKKAQLASLVWHILRISMTLKHMVKKRKGLLSERENLEEPRFLNSRKNRSRQADIVPSPLYVNVALERQKPQEIVSPTGTRAHGYQKQPTKEPSIIQKGSQDDLVFPKELLLPQDEERKDTLHDKRKQVPLKPTKAKTKLHEERESAKQLMGSYNYKREGSPLGSPTKQKSTAKDDSSSRFFVSHSHRNNPYFVPDGDNANSGQDRILRLDFGQSDDSSDLTDH